MPKKIKFGIIGCSRIAERAVIPAIISSKKAEVSIIGSRDKNKAKEFAKKFHCKSSGSYYDVVNSNVDAAYISLPIALHEKWALIAAKAGKHILCEKSAAISFKSAHKMVKACKENNIRILEGLMFSFHPQHQRVMKLVKSKYLGELHAFYGKYYLPNPSKNDIRLKKGLGGGVLNDAGCYPVSASRMIYGEEPLEVTSNLIFDKKYGVDVKADALLKYPNKKIALVSVAYGMEYMANYGLFGSKGSITVKRAYAIPKELTAEIVVQSKGKTKIIKVKHVDQFLLMINAFCDEIKRKKAKLNFEEELLKQARVMEAIRESSKDKKAIRLKQNV